jgi:hypothetical protein
MTDRAISAEEVDKTLSAIETDFEMGWLDANDPFTLLDEVRKRLGISLKYPSVADLRRQRFSDSEINQRARERGLRADMEEAHAQGMHDDLPREGCPSCLDR